MVLSPSSLFKTIEVMMGTYDAGRGTGDAGLGTED
jgi:hypothetical protein